MLLGTGSNGSNPAPGVSIAPQAFYKASYYVPFIQDDWKVTPKLTLNLGLRYDLQPFYVDRHDRGNYATFRDGRMLGRPAVTRNRHGKGWVFYVGTDSAEAAFHETLARAVGEVGNLSPLIAAPYGVEVVSRENSGTTFYFLLNLTETAHNDIQLPRPMDDLITGQPSVTKVSLGPLDVAVLASPKTAEMKRKV